MNCLYYIKNDLESNLQQGISWIAKESKLYQKRFGKQSTTRTADNRSDIVIISKTIWKAIYNRRLYENGHEILYQKRFGKQSTTLRSQLWIMFQLYQKRFGKQSTTRCLHLVILHELYQKRFGKQSTTNAWHLNEQKTLYQKRFGKQSTTWNVYLCIA